MSVKDIIKNRSLARSAFEIMGFVWEDIAKDSLDKELQCAIDEGRLFLSRNDEQRDVLRMIALLLRDGWQQGIVCADFPQEILIEWVRFHMLATGTNPDGVIKVELVESVALGVYRCTVIAPSDAFIDDKPRLVSCRVPVFDKIRPLANVIDGYLRRLDNKREALAFLLQKRLGHLRVAKVWLHETEDRIFEEDE